MTYLLSCKPPRPSGQGSDLTINHTEKFLMPGKKNLLTYKMTLKHWVLSALILCGLVLCVVTSVFMALETSDFFAAFYNSKGLRWIVGAILLESFMLLMTIIRFENNPWFTIASKFVAVLLFLMIVGTASFPHVSKDLGILETAKMSDKALKVVAEAVASNKMSQQYFQSTKQRTNVAIRVLKNDELIDKLVGVKVAPTVSIWLSIIFVVGVRFLLQLCNIMTAYGVGLQVEALKLALISTEAPTEPAPEPPTTRLELTETRGAATQIKSEEDEEEVIASLPLEAEGREMTIDPESIRDELKHLNITQGDIAEKTGLSKGSVSTAINHFNTIVNSIVQESKNQLAEKDEHNFT